VARPRAPHLRRHPPSGLSPHAGWASRRHGVRGGGQSPRRHRLCVDRSAHPPREPRLAMGRVSLREIWLRLRRHPGGLLGLAGALCFTLLAIIGPWVAPADPMALNPNALRPPGRGHWLGTDDLGRDILSGVLHGARVSLVVGLLAAAGSVLVGVAVGAAAGYWRGRV